MGLSLFNAILSFFILFFIAFILMIFLAKYCLKNNFNFEKYVQTLFPGIISGILVGLFLELKNSEHSLFQYFLFDLPTFIILFVIILITGVYVSRIFSND